MQRTLMEQKAVTSTYGSVNSGAENSLQCTQYADFVQVDDVKIDIKEEANDQATARDDEVRAHTSFKKTSRLLWNAKEEPRGLESAQSATIHHLPGIGFQTNQECYYVRSLLVQCPACDTSYRGGRHQLPRLFAHVKKCHKKNCSRFIKSVKARYRARKTCDCFACLKQRALNP